MTYHLAIQEKATYLHIVVTGQNTRENVMRYMEDVFRECRARNCRNVLIEERLEGPRLGTIDIYKMVSAGALRFAGMIDAMAYVDMNAKGKLMQFAEDVASNRGIPVQVFATVNDAEKWMLQTRSEQGAAGDTDKPRR